MLPDASTATAVGECSFADVASPPSPPLPAPALPATVVIMVCISGIAAVAAGFCAVENVVSLIRTVFFDISVGVVLKGNKFPCVNH